MPKAKDLKPGTTYLQPSEGHLPILMTYTGDHERGRGPIAPEWEYRFTLADGHDWWLTTSTVVELVEQDV